MDKQVQMQEQPQERTGEEVWTDLLLQVVDMAAESREWYEITRESFAESTYTSKEQADYFYWRAVKPHDYQYAAQLDILTNVFCLSEELAEELVEDAMSSRAADRNQ